ncbi:hypothetical protein MPTK1_8g11130 [Marchantia polymorpha subsp. ruderalis]|uniref:Uncharacterized protein n=1 Tax=Marchantia polymorpha TaxID=3197 RepID=A0A2R6XMJ5_MARPO|nr:hypothetical protein MARPO_0008s0108 [Marchantia polymorpha]BBN19492.1 hypothetical protein Mp_8g11130 [Marchantia polymorpha subsp. ruderalis]|eukprot:PTQ47337.1 hypothetical protein MARPO_0008s0108 [Marchantia polymorpha]
MRLYVQLDMLMWTETISCNMHVRRVRLDSGEAVYPDLDHGSAIAQEMTRISTCGRGGLIPWRPPPYQMKRKSKY